MNRIHLSALKQTCAMHIFIIPGRRWATFPLFIFEEQQEWTFIFIVLIKYHSMHQLVVHLFCFQFFASTRSPARQTIDIYLHALLLLVRSFGALAPKLTARVGGVVTAPARAIAEIVATSAQASLAFRDGRGIASALFALPLPRYLEKCKLGTRIWWYLFV